MSSHGSNKPAHSCSLARAFASGTQKRDAAEDSGQNGLGVLCTCTLVYSKVQIFSSKSKTTENRLN